MATRSSRIPRWIEDVFRLIAAFSRRMTEPSVKIAPKQRRRIRLLAAFLLLMTLDTLAGSMTLNSVSGNSWLIMAATSATFLFSYCLSRTMYYRAALILALIIPAVPPLTIAILKPPEINLTAELMWLSLPLMISSLMLTARQTIIMASSYIAFFIILELLGSLGIDTLAPLIAYILIVTFIVAAIATVRRLDHAEIEDQLTERLHAEKALRESEEKFFKAFNTGPQMIVITRARDNITLEVNDNFTRATGFTREEAVGHTANALGIWVTPEDNERLIRILSEKGCIHNEEFNYRDKSGGINTHLVSIEPINISGEECWIAIIIDITERKLMEQALRESEEKFSKAFSSSPNAVSIVSIEEDKFIEVNESFFRFTGYQREEVIGHNSAELGLWVNQDEFEHMTGNLREKGSIYNQEYHSRTKSGDIRVGLFSANELTIGGKPCVILVITDITEQKQVEEKLKSTLADLERSTARLKAMNKELESFSYSVSHDLRSPLRSIDGFSQALLEDYATRLDETGRDYLNRLRGASQKMGELIDGLLKLSRLTRSEMHPEKVDLSALAKEISTRLQETYPEKRVKLVIDSGLNAEGDPQLLRVLLENLLGNAWKFTTKTPHARIEFGSTANGGEKAFFIKDNGAGFDMAYKDKLFRAFQRLHDTTDFPGTGIGLATVQRIINRHGGNIHAEGVVGKGAAFYFTLS